jgi:GntR family transcriptional repressor for pyruvate dehydrogenase complex
VRPHPLVIPANAGIQRIKKAPWLKISSLSFLDLALAKPSKGESMAVIPLRKSDPWSFEQAHSGATLSSRIVDDVCAALFAKRLAPGDFLGTEKDIAERAGASRIVARDALRTLQALGVVEIRAGAGGGARIAGGNPGLFSQALAVQLSLAGITAREMMDAQRGIECMAAELAAEHARPEDLAVLRDLLAEHEAVIEDPAAYTRSCMRFHLAVAEASRNRVLVAQLLSLQHVSWPAENRTLTMPVARHILDVHRQIADVIEARDARAARRAMDDHVKMIRARRVNEGGDDPTPHCC